jgi:NAD(P)-dependent dehydrogenase (short-subunit alcohol dehydrogenase family)
MVMVDGNLRVVVAGSEGRTGKRLAEHYRQSGGAVDEIALTPGIDIDRAVAAIGQGPVDLLIIADDEAPPDRGVSNLTREDMRAGFDRLTFAPFRVAALLRPQLAAAHGTVALLTRHSATMEHRDRAGRYLERPFRAAAHALWRCFSIEWQADGINCLLIAIRDPEVELVPRAIGEAVPQVPASLKDVVGATLPW